MTLLMRAREIADDHDSGAAELTARLLPLLAEALVAGGDAAREVARAVLFGQPAMAPLWHACAAAVSEADQPGTFARMQAEMQRAPQALVRAASRGLRDLLTDSRDPLVLTLSYSSSVSAVLREVAAHTGVRAVCAEGRPRFEGRRLATELAASGVPVTVVVDAALTAFLGEAAAVITGADAVTPASWINKVGSFGVAAAASEAGVPLYVIAARDKFAPARLGPRLNAAPADPDEVWRERAPGVDVENRYFERVPVELATIFLTEAGPVTPTDVPAVADRKLREISFLLQQLA
jgi:translation initiation factor 2B subunit (eIF-2B alpha/beta/delta family)